MEYRKLGRTDIEVSLICLGTMTWGKQNNEEEGHAQMDMAVEHGVNFFDTAELYAVPPSGETYGKTESIIGNWFTKNKNRDKIILASKVAGPGMSWIRNGKNYLDRKNMTEALEGSLKRLKTDYIDLYQLHWPNRTNFHFGRYWSYNPAGLDRAKVEDEMMEILETLSDFIKAGKIRHAGLSNESSWGVMNYTRLSEKHNLPRMVSIQNEYSLLCRIFEPELAETAILEDVGLLAWSPLASGFITGKYLDGKRPEGTRWAISGSRYNQRDTKRSNEATRAYLDVAKKYNLDIAQMALAFVNSRPFVTSNIIGATTLAQLKSDLESIHVKLSPEVLADIEAIRKDFAVPY